MKNLIIIALCCTALMARATSTLDLSSASLNLTGSSTSSSTPGTALSLTANTNGNVLVVATFSTKASIKKDSAEGIWQLKSTSQTSTPIKRSLENKADLGIASVVHVFTNITVNETIALQHSSSDSLVTVTTRGANLVAIPLTVSSGETLDYGLHQQSGTSSITSTNFLPTVIKTSVDLPRATSNRLYMAASFNSQTTATTFPAIGTWKLQYRKGTDTWTDTGSEISRSMSTANNIGAVTLYGLVEGLTLGTYEVQVVCKSAAGKTIQTLNGTLAAVSLSYGEDPSLSGGHFDGFSVNATSLNRADTNQPTVDGAKGSLNLANGGSIFASMNFSAVPTTGANQTGAFDLSTTITQTTLTGSGNQENQRFFTSTTDYGSGGSAGYFSGLAAGTNSIYGRYENTTGPISVRAATLVGFATEATVDPSQVGSLGNFVWEDLNGDGLQDSGEPGLTNVTVYLFDSSSNELTSVVTDLDGEYAFTNLQSGTYYVQIALPDGYTNTLMLAGDDTALDNDGNAAGWSGPETVVAGETNSDVDFGLYLPAKLFGYLFIDENDDQIRNTGDTTITNAQVQLIVDSAILYSTFTDTNGRYEFTDVPAGVVTVQVVQADATLVAVPATNDVMRNRAVTISADTAIIEFSVTSGYGVLAANPDEPLNFGYVNHPLSTRIDLTVYATTDGRVMIELFTVNENGNNDIEIYAIMDGDWVMVAMVPSEQVEGTGSHSYTVEAIGLTPGASYLFKIVDESEHIFYTDTAIEVALVQLRALSTSLDPEYFTMKFNTEPYTEYELKVSSSLAADAEWTTEYVQIVHPLFPNGVSSFTQRIQGAPEGTTTLRVPRNRDKAFFKLIKVE
jgi:hypothetical protein